MEHPRYKFSLATYESDLEWWTGSREALHAALQITLSLSNILIYSKVKPKAFRRNISNP